jgi:threonylcarbamoyladenosine tRNA methylthiotransferase MtaB
MPAAVVQQRSRLLRDLSTRKKVTFYRGFSGRTLRVLFECRDESGLYTGFSDNYIKVGVTAESEVANQLLPVRLHGVKKGLAVGSLPPTLAVPRRAKG